ncbi:MAG: ferritin-like domain-containing protein [Alphaproteobacteria bacterium]|nr:ferritin-like domain-containing protein [Alphaproteobacteria bacterium]OJV12082.1 MAG: hypothetical protein BGO27_05000 [Alphaproteobacteria bacterium 33-17]
MPLNNIDTQKVLLDLYHHEIAARDIYKEVLSHVTDNKIFGEIKTFAGQHEDHIRNLAEVLEKISTKEIDESKDMKGYLMSAYATLRSMTGQDGALKALHTAEEVILKRYQEAANEDLEQDYKDLVNTHLKQEEEHSAYINKVVEEMAV